VGDWAAVWFLRKRNKSHNRTLKERRKKRKHPDEWASLVMKRNVRRFKTLNDQLGGGDVEEIERNILRNARAREANGFDDDSASGDLAGHSDMSTDSEEPEDENYERFYQEEEGNTEPDRRQEQRFTQFSDEELYARPVRPPTGAQRRKQHEEGGRSAPPKRLEERQVQHEGRQEATPRNSETQFSDEELYARPVRAPTGTKRRKQHEEGERSAPPKRLEERQVQHEGRQEATPRNSETQFSDEELYARPVRAATGTKRRKQHEEGERSALPKRLEERQVQHEGRQEATRRKSGTQNPKATVKPKITDQMKTTTLSMGTHDRPAGIKGWPPVNWDNLPKRLEERQVQHEGRQEATLRKSGTQNPKATVKPKITDQMKTTTLSMGTHDRPAGIKGWPPVNWDNLPKRLEERQVQHEGRQEATLRKSGTQFSDEELYARPVRPPTGAQRRKQPEEGERTTLPKGLEERRVKHEGHEEDTRWKSVTQKPMATVKPKHSGQMKTTVQSEARRPNVIPSSQSLPTPLKQGKSASRHFNG
jgi:hypothetical protein